MNDSMDDRRGAACTLKPEGSTAALSVDGEGDVGRRGATHGLVYVTCPCCRGRITEPFLRTAGPVAFVHHRHRHRSCRLIVLPGEGRAVVVADSESLEVALMRVGIPAA